MHIPERKKYILKQKGVYISFILVDSQPSRSYSHTTDRVIIKITIILQSSSFACFQQNADFITFYFLDKYNVKQILCILIIL